MVWSQHAKLTTSDLTPTESTSFGKWMVSWNQTLIVSAPDASSKRGEYVGTVSVKLFRFKVIIGLVAWMDD